VSVPPPEAWPAGEGRPRPPTAVPNPGAWDRRPGSGSQHGDADEQDWAEAPGDVTTPVRHSGTLPGVAAAWAVPGWVASLVAGSLLAAVGAQFAGPNGALTQALGEIGLWAGMIGTVLLVVRRYATGNLARDLGVRFAPLDLVWGFVAAGCALVLSLLVEAAFTHTRFAGSNTAVLSQQKGHELGLIVVSVLVSLGAPFFEEIFFRGYLRKSFEPLLGPNGAVLAQAGCFALAHLGEVSGWGNVSVLTALFVVGAVLGFTAKATGRLAGGMVAHGLFNLVAVLTVI
jgi:membrane protease YdiL (CAAX protease family)